jgi:para-nitrobenzyl esterase
MMGNIVTVDAGRLQGALDDGVQVFKGIPYAAAPVGERRWQAPAPVEPWDGVRDATQPGLVVLQTMMPPPFGSPLPPMGDDCLNLNVWTPDTDASGLPVLVWIHGGAFVSGSGIEATYDGASFARHGVVCVTINYRLGAQGFWHLADHFPELADAGNVGMLDQIAALQWVQDNIASFGGDPSRVTIAGESAGGMSVGTLLAMPAARGLFQQAILQSGAGHNGIDALNASMIAGHLLDALGVTSGDIDALHAVTPQQLLDAQAALTLEMQTTRDPVRFGAAAGSAMPFQPTYGTPAVPHRPIDAIAGGSAADVDILIGTTMEESLVFVVAMADMFNDEMVALTMDAVFAGQGATALEKYRAKRPDAAPHAIVGAVETDRMFRVPAVRLADAQAAHNPNVWMYRFDWQTPVFDGAFGACHALELSFVFNTLNSGLAAAFNGPDAPQSLADSMHRAWARFVTAGSPSHDGLPEWPRYDSTDRPTMSFGVTSHLMHQPDADELGLWDGVI